MHRDVKGANVLVDAVGICKLADFGASKVLQADLMSSDGCRSLRGTPYWMAPEVIKQTGHGYPADIWSVGCTIVEMLTAAPPWSHFSSQISALFHIASSKAPPAMPPGVSDSGAELMLLCFRRDPRERPTCAQLLQHPFFLDQTQSRQSPGQRAVFSQVVTPTREATSGGAAKATDAAAAAAAIGAAVGEVDDDGGDGDSGARVRTAVHNHEVLSLGTPRPSSCSGQAQLGAAVISQDHPSAPCSSNFFGPDASASGVGLDAAAPAAPPPPRTAPAAAFTAAALGVSDDPPAHEATHRTSAAAAAEDAALDAPVVIVKGVLMALSPRGLERLE